MAGEKKKFKLPVNTLLALFLKSSKLIKLLKVFKALKATKALLTIGTMALSTFVYSFTMSPWFAVGFVLMLFIHEMGHIIALKMRGHPASAPVFIPMLGAVIFAPEFKNRGDEAWVGFGGPLLGSIAALGAFALWSISPEDSPLLLSLSYTAAFLNLFNLVPIRPMDGGRVTQIVGGWFKWFGICLLVWLVIVTEEPSLLLIFILIVGDFKMKPKLQYQVAVIITVTMSWLMFHGLGRRRWWMDMIDIFLAIIFTSGYWMRFDKWVEGGEEIEELPPAPLPIKLKWVGLYAALVIGLVFMMYEQVPYLPVHRP